MTQSEYSAAVRDEDAGLSMSLRRNEAIAIGLGIFALAFAIFWPTTASLAVRWNDTDPNTYTHGYLVVLTSAWLLWRDRGRLQATAAAPFPLAMLALAITSCVWLLSLRSGIQAGHQVLLPVLIWLAMAGALGWRSALVAMLAVGYLYFAIPIWGAASGALQALTTVIVEKMLHATGVVATIDGNLIHLPSGTFEIAAGCSGVHYFIVALAIAVVYGEIHRDSLKVRVLLLALAALMSMATNWVRVYIIVVAGYLTDMQHYLVRVEHERFGWVVFAVMMASYILVVRLLPASSHGGPRQHATLAMPGQPRSWAAAIAAVSLMSIGPVWNYATDQLSAPQPARDELLPHVSLAAISGPLPSAHFNWKPYFRGVDDSVDARYVAHGHDVEVHMAVYASQGQGKELVSYDNSILGAERAEVLSELNVDGWRELEIVTASGHEVIRYQYAIGATRTSNDLRAQVSYGLQSLVGAPLSRLVAMRTGCVPDCTAARLRLGAVAGILDRSGASSSKEILRP